MCHVRPDWQMPVCTKLPVSWSMNSGLPYIMKQSAGPHDPLSDQKNIGSKLATSCIWTWSPNYSPSLNCTVVTLITCCCLC